MSWWLVVAGAVVVVALLARRLTRRARSGEERLARELARAVARERREEPL